MARTNTVEAPVKVTLYLPGETTERAKEFASDYGRSLSQLVTRLLEREMGTEIRETIQLPPKVHEALVKKANRKKIHITQFITEMLNESVGN
jgi:predicted HicB family RNase H-like nuclease